MEELDLRAAFADTLDQAIGDARDCLVARSIEDGTLTLDDYRTLLATLFHQTRESSYSFALASAHCPWRHLTAKEYLLHHAYDEHTHWRWILDDLRAVGYAGPDPQQAQPHPTARDYVEFNRETAVRSPLARLAIAMTLEGIAARFGASHGPRLIRQLGLDLNQATFLISHTETDVKHSAELADVLAATDPTPDEWETMCAAAVRTSQLYRAMYDHAGYRGKALT